MRAESDKRWRIRGELQIGGAVNARGREYTLVNVEPYTTKLGRSSMLLKWHGNCVTCDEQFAFRTGRGGFVPYANCKRHRPGGGDYDDESEVTVNEVTA